MINKVGRIHISQFDHVIATGHPHDEVVLDGVQYGFSLQYHGPPIPTTSHIDNHQSAVQNPRQVNSYVEKETAEGAMIGPFQDPSFTWIHTSPLMSRLKSSTDNQERRIIVDLSFPPEANVNM